MALTVLVSVLHLRMVLDVEKHVIAHHVIISTDAMSHLKQKVDKGSIFVSVYCTHMM